MVSKDITKPLVTETIKYLKQSRKVEMRDRQHNNMLTDKFIVTLKY